MPITGPVWDDHAQSILYTTFTNPWTWEEYDDFLFALSEMVNTVSHRVDLIQDLRHGQHYPPGGPDHMRQLVTLLPQHVQSVVIVGPNDLLIHLNNLVLRIAGLKAEIHYAASPDEAYRVIGEARRQVS